jgi:hypothetical protein
MPRQEYLKAKEGFESLIEKCRNINLEKEIAFERYKAKIILELQEVSSRRDTLFENWNNAVKRNPNIVYICSCRNH